MQAFKQASTKASLPPAQLGSIAVLLCSSVPILGGSSHRSRRRSTLRALCPGFLFSCYLRCLSLGSLVRLPFCVLPQKPQLSIEHLSQCRVQPTASLKPGATDLGVAAIIQLDTAVTREHQEARSYGIQQSSVVRRNDHAALPTLEDLLQLLHSGDVQVIGGLQSQSRRQCSQY